MSGGRGLLFGNHGSIVSASPFTAQASQGNSSCTVQILLEPKSHDSTGMILAFYSPEDRVVSFSMRQWRRGLVLEHSRKAHFTGLSEIYLDNVFTKPGPVFVTITSSKSGTSGYLGGTLLFKAPDFVLLSRDLRGELIMGDAPRESHNWSGRLTGLAIYDRDLSPDEISTSLFYFTNPGRPTATSNRGVIARYVFQEDKGNIVRSQVDSAPDLIIPDRFFVLDKWFLQWPWDEFRPGWHYWKNILINILGFIPLGLCFCMYFWQVKNSGAPVVFTIALGLAVSLIIEILQAFLPTRDSGVTDLFTNTVGTAIGAMTFRYGANRSTMLVR